MEVRVPRRRLFSGAFQAVGRCLLASLAVASTAFAVPGFYAQVSASSGNPNWAQQTPGQSPSSRAWAAMDYDSARSRTVLFGGYDGSKGLSDTWEWDGSGWSNVSTFPSPPAAVEQTMAYDSSRQVSVLLVNSVTWEWDGQKWALHPTANAPSPREAPAMVYDAVRKQMVLFGGQNSTGLLGDTWTFDGKNWTRKAPAGAPSARLGAAMAFDAARGVVVLFGGRTADQRTNDTWEWDGTTWTQRSSSTVPLARFFHSMTFDAQLGKTVMFGGDRFDPGAGLGPINDTWLWDGTNWTRIWTEMAPGPRAAQSMAFDSAHNQTVLFGGTDELIPGVYWDQTWEFAPGNATPPGNPTLSFSANTQSFGGPAVGTTGGPATILVTSSGTGPVLITAISTSGDFSLIGNDCPSAPDALAPGSYCAVQVAFSPTTCGYRSGNLNFADNGADGQQAVFLQGVGTAAGCDSDVLVSPPNDITVNASSSSGAVVKYLAAHVTDFDEALNPPAVSCDHASGSTFPIGTTVVTCQATDSDDTPSTGTATFRVTVNDTDLGLSGVPADVSVDPSSPSGAVVNYTTPTAVDEDAIPPAVVCSPASGSTFPVGVTTVTCQTSDPDDAQGSVSATFRVHVGDSDLALTNVPSGIHATATGARGAAAFFNPVAVDEESPVPVVTCDHPSGSAFPVGVTTVTCQTTDSDDTPSMVIATFQVTVTDADLVLTNVPAPLPVNAPAGSTAGAPVTYTAPTANDEDGGSATCVPASGSMFPIGTTNVTCWVTDADDTPNTATAVFPVTVNDTDFTLVGVPADITAVAVGPSGTTVSYTAPTAVDEDANPLPVSCDHASGSTFPVGATTVVCQAVDPDDLGSAFAFFHVTVIPDVGLSVAVSPTTAHPHDTVTSTASLTNLGTFSERVTVTYTVVYTDSNFNQSTVASNKAIVNLAAGTSATRLFTFSIKNQTPTGFYTVIVTATDITGTVTQYGNFTVA